jgi:alanine-glyoxylate transaminase/serine-glyoxylate transaminase/serine-pyruvate transaminase
MSLSLGREFLSIPGPSVLPDSVIRAMARPSVNIYEGEIVEITQSILRDLKPVARTTARPFIYIANGHGAWEAALANTLSRGDRLLVLESGRFAAGWGEMARAMGCAVETLHAAPRRGVDPNAVEARLRADVDRRIKAILVVQVDTASSVWNDIAAIRKAIDAAGHPALYMVDVVASQGCMPFEMDAWGVDVTVGGAQKGLMTPPGMAFCWANERALAAAETADLNTQYWDWRFRSGPEQYQNFCGTAPIHLLFALREALDLLAAETLEGAWTRHAVLAEAVRAAVEAWAADGPLEFNILDPRERSDSVTTVLTGAADAEAFRTFCRDQFGLVLGLGLGEFAGRSFRIGHMGWLNPPMILGTLGAAQAGLEACGVRRGSGALDAAAAVIARHAAATTRAQAAE